MPLYEYQCLPHHHRFEVRHGMNEEGIKECAVCGGEVRRVIHPVGIVFKGTGFYATDSKSSSSTAKTPDSKSTEKTEKAEKPATTASDSGSKGESAAAS